MRINIKFLKTILKNSPTLQIVLVGIVIFFGVAFIGTDGSNVYSPETKLNEAMHEKLLIEDYIKNNIGRITPERVTAGKTWHLVNVIVNIDKQTGTFMYSDGMKSGQAYYTYNKDDHGLLSFRIGKLK